MASLKSQWEKFFLNAGLSQQLSLEYAATFSRNRMTLDMLSELNKDILQDLGVKALGDIITILRFAKEEQSGMKRSPSPQPKQTTTSQVKPQPPKMQPKSRAQSSLENVKSKVASSNSPMPKLSQLKVTTTQKLAQKTGNGKIQEKPVRAANINNSNVLNASSALVTTKPIRKKLSERFDQFETDSKRKKVEVNEMLRIQTTPEVQEVKVGDRIRQTPDRPNVAGPALPAKNMPRAEGKYIGIKVGDKIKLKPVSQQIPKKVEVNKLVQSTQAQPTQFTVQVPSKQPSNMHDVPKSKPKITVVPAQGKTLNRTKPLMSIFDRLDVPPSSIVKLSSNDEKDNVFRRLGTRSIDNKFTGNESKVAIGVVHPASSTTRVGEKHSPDSVFNRLGDPNL